MPWKPEHEHDFPTLGWQAIDWMTTYLARPDVPDYEPFIPYPEQEDFILRFYELNPKTGKRKIHRGVLSRPRGWGKSPFAGAMCALEALGPVVPAGWDADGQPVGMPWSEIRTPLVQIAAVSEDQTKNTWIALQEMMESEALYEDYDGLEVMGGHINLPRGQIKPISASATSVKGARAVFSIMDQALALDTPIPTPNGWVTMGELKAGDVIYGTHGTVKVSEAKPVSTEHDCYRVTFADGTSVVASAGHLWQSRRTGWPVNYRDKVRTTEEMLDGYKYRIPAAKIMDSPDVDLPADPYLLGLWLGDGTRGKCEITVGKQDVKNTIAILEGRGIETFIRRYTRHGKLDNCFNVSFSERRGYQGENRPEHAKRISSLPCYEMKHVPEIFFTGSANQRLELLQGLMDSDGCATKLGVCTFVNTNKALADAVVRLARSLGQVISGVKTITDSRYTTGEKYRVDFTPRHNLVPFKLERKAARVKNSTDDHISIVSIEPVERVPVRCIAVDSEDHLFAFGEAGHLTHNTEVWTYGNGGQKLAETMRSNAAKLGGSTLETPNAFIPGLNSVAETSASFWSQIRAGTAKDDGLYFDHREAPADTDMSDRDSLIKGLRIAYGDASAHEDGCVIHKPSCPAGHVDLDRLVSTIWDPATDPQLSRSDFLNQVTHASDSWISQPELRAIIDRNKELQPADEIVLGFDGSQGRTRGKADATALVGMRVADKHLFEIKTWEKQPHDPQDWAPNTLEVDAVVTDCFDRYNVIGFYADPSGWTGQVAEWEAKFHRKLRVKASRNAPISAWPRGKDTRVVDAVEQMRQAIVMGEITMSDSPNLIRHILNARRRDTRTGYLLYKAYPDSPEKIDAAYAAVMAYKACLDAIGAGYGQPRTSRKRKAVIL